MIDENLISYYFELNGRIAKVKRRLKKMRFEFYQQTMASYCTSDEQKIYTQGFPVEKKVITLLDAEAMAEASIELMRYKQKHFLRYLKQLPYSDRYFLKRKYKWHETCMNDRVERECFEEILEIEEAAGYRFMGYEPHIQVDEIEEVMSDNFAESSENCFEKMLAKLGV